MGAGLIEFYQNKIKKSWKIAFVSAIVIGLLVHFYKFSNNLINHDTIYNFYHDQNMIGLGRWFLSIACGISSYFDLPWINGILSMLWISLTVVVLVDLFEIDNPIAIILVGGIIVSFPAITDTFHYGFTADGYMLAMLFAALAVWISSFNRKKVLCNIMSIILICLACGIYQAYVSFALVLTLGYFVFEVFENRYSSQEYLKYIVKQLFIFTLALIVYYIVWNLCMKMQGVVAANYQGISEMTSLKEIFSVSWIISGVVKSVKIVLLFFVERNIFENRMTLYAALNLIFLLFFGIGIIVSAIKCGLLKRRLQIMFIIVSLVLCFPSAGIWYFVTENIEYRTLMLQSLSIIYVLAIVIYDKWCTPKWSNVFAVVLVLIIFNNSIIANISYFYLDKSYKETYATALEMKMRIDEIESDNEFDRIVVVGRAKEKGSLTEQELAPIPMLGDCLIQDYLFVKEHIPLFLQHTFHDSHKYADAEESKRMSTDERVREMGIWPSKHALQVIDDCLVIKISDIQ